MNHVRLGSLAEISVCDRRVRFSPLSSKWLYLRHMRRCASPGVLCPTDSGSKIHCAMQHTALAIYCALHHIIRMIKPRPLERSPT